MREVRTHLRVQDPAAVETALAAADLAAGGDGPLVAIMDADVAPDEVADVLAGWIAAARYAMVAKVDVVTVLADDHLDGGDVGRLSVGHGVIAASRSYGFEGQRDGLVANVVVGPLETGLEIAAWVLASRTISGQVLLVGDQHHGRQRP